MNTSFWYDTWTWEKIQRCIHRTIQCHPLRFLVIYLLPTLEEILQGGKMISFSGKMQYAFCLVSGHIPVIRQGVLFIGLSDRPNRMRQLITTSAEVTLDGGEK